MCFLFYLYLFNRTKKEEENIHLIAYGLAELGHWRLARHNCCPREKYATGPISPTRVGSCHPLMTGNATLAPTASSIYCYQN
jgi:hypothetical protein